MTSFSNIFFHINLRPKLSRISLHRNLSRTKHIREYPRLVSNEVLKSPGKQLSIDDELFNSLKGKIIYNCLVSRRNRVIRWYVRKQKTNQQKKVENNPSVPLSLKYKFGDVVYQFNEYKEGVEGSVPASCNEQNDFEDSENVILPYSVSKKVDFQSDTEIELDKNNERSIGNIFELRKQKFENNMTDVDPPQIKGKKWMSDYEVYEESTPDEDALEVNISQENYGTADPNILPTKIPCGGCGAYLHCQSSSIPGYLPKEIFLKCTNEDFHRIVCQRCSFMKHYNVALSVFVEPDAYSKLLASLKSQTCCLVMLVDMTDFPCSIWPNILDIVGHDKPIVLVGNKIDLIPGDSKNWLEHATEVLRENFPKKANVLSTSLISAKTGFGVEHLITTLHSKWGKRGDVYLVGCTNVGKSSLFNDFINSDFCKSKAVNLMQRATVSPWPGTTLNLLKFPIFRMEGWRAFLRNQRIQKEKLFLINQKKLENLQKKEDGLRVSRLPEISGNIGRTFRYVDTKKNKYNETPEEFVLPKLTNKFLNTDERPFLDPNDKDFATAKWCYDTPGVVHQDQIIDLLTIEELNELTTNSVYHARIFSVYLKQSLFIGGLARIDFVASESDFIRFVVHSPCTLPVTICWTEAADEIYNTLLGTEYMKVPRGSAQRLEKWPMLKSNEDVEFTGKGHAFNLSEIVLSSAGWVSFTAKPDVKFKIRPWTPEGRGIHLRKTPLLRYSCKQRRSRVTATPTYYMSYYH